MTVARYGSWRSPITADLIVREMVQLGQIALDGRDVYWTELRPAEAGRVVVVRQRPGGAAADVTPPGFNARTRVHEYGGGAYAVAEGTVYFSNFADQRLYRQDTGAAPRAITPAQAVRYADGVIDPRRSRMICVREDHTAAGREAVNTLVSLDLEGRTEARVLVSGNDFYSSPRLSPDGSRLAWLAWSHPNMPWDETQLWIATVAPDGSIREATQAAGSQEESIFQPEWSPEGQLYFVSDRTGWWNLYRWVEPTVEVVVQMEAECGRPQWVFGMSTYAFESARRIVCALVQNGVHRLVAVDLVTRSVSELTTAYKEFFPFVRAAPGAALAIAGAPGEPQSVVRIDLQSGQTQVLRRSAGFAIESGYLSIPQPMVFPTTGGRTAHAFYYTPKNRDYTAPTHELPPLIVRSHGGPTSATVASLNPQIQFFTSRGFGVVDVNYGGSTGFGRPYRERLNGQWGVVDVDDCVNAARYLVGRGLVDGDRLAISGGSAGGYTTLCCLTFRDIFKAGANHFGLSDLEAFVEDTHKFESRYLVRLVGPYPERRELYRERSPVHFADRIACPLIVFQGLEDAIVPPSQSELIVKALRQKGLPVAYLAFEGEQHGFRQGANIKRALEGELYFYSRVFGFEPADAIEPVPIENLSLARA